MTPDERLEAARTEGRERIRAAIYCRVSLAALGSTIKVEDQERQCREVCRMRGWEIGKVYKDNSRSAWQRKRKRPGWDQMLADIATGRYGALVSYWGDRLVRQPRDLEDLLDLREVRQITMASVAGQYDFDNPDHRMMMRWEVARACNESDTTSRRVINYHAKRRAQGLTRSGGRGGRAYGFATDGVTRIPAECELIREAARRVLAGEHTGAIARDLSARGARLPTGGEFSHHTLRKMLARPRYAGLMPDGENTAAWKPVLDRETWEAVRLILDTKADGFSYATNARRWLLSGIAECGLCGSPLQIRAGRDRASRDAKPYFFAYGCVQPGCRKVYRSAPLLDAYVSRRTASRLANPANPPGIPSHANFGPEFQHLTTERAATETAVKDYRTSPGRVELLMTRLDSIDVRLGELRELAGGSSRARIMEAHAGITAGEFGALPLGTRRALIAACYQVTVLPASKRGPGFRTEDVELKPR